MEFTLKRMNLNKGASLDLISPLFLRICSDLLAEPLSMIFNKSINDCVFPDQWKLCHVIPIFKSGKKVDVRNYRGVTIELTLAKVFEMLVDQQLKLNVNHLLSKSQHGFLPNRNIETNLTELSVRAVEAFEAGKQIDIFYADIQKAFDTVDQSLLIRKMAKFPISNKTLRWFASYFKNRKQVVRVNSSVSDTFEVPSSVGQGTILGPLLFLIFFDDFDMNIGSTVALNFADDKKLLRIVSNNNDAVELQRSIDNFMVWCSNNALQVKIAKCKILTLTHRRNPIKFDYYVNGSKVYRVDEIRDLGVMIDSKLSFATHIEYMKKKSMAMLSFVKRNCRQKFELDSAKLLYGSLVRSNLEFASTVWLPHHKSYKVSVESVQKQAVIYLNGDYLNRGGNENNYVLKPYVERCNALELTTLVRRRISGFIHPQNHQWKI